MQFEQLIFTERNKKLFHFNGKECKFNFLTLNIVVKLENRRAKSEKTR